jgi:predicted nucleotidyltransferase
MKCDRSSGGTPAVLGTGARNRVAFARALGDTGRMVEQGAVVATRLVRQRFPAARAAWLGGSVAARRSTPTSDLDITVLLDGPPAPFRTSDVAEGWPVEFFVQTEQSLQRFCELDRARRRPTTMRLVGSSIVLIDRDGIGQQLQAVLHQLDLDGPAPTAEHELEGKRYVITDLLADLAAARADDEALVVAAALVHEVGDFVLAAKRRWSGSGKWLLRELGELDRDAHTGYGSGLANGLRAVASGDRRPVLEFVAEVLDEFGGPVFAGYHRSARPELTGEP